jgi:hypothetical protein
MSTNCECRTEELLPDPYQMVVVQCDGFRCAAFLDNHGTWRDYYRQCELKNVPGWSAIGSGRNVGVVDVPV